VGKGGQEALVDAGAWLRCDVLKAPQHGETSALTDRFLKWVDPEVVVVPAGDLFAPERPTADQRLEDVRVYRLADRGTVEIVSDGNRYSVVSR
jgi:beta-lactamase superfamily II metal-dependent hydrolase